MRPSRLADKPLEFFRSFVVDGQPVLFLIYHEKDDNAPDLQIHVSIDGGIVRSALHPTFTGTSIPIRDPEERIEATYALLYEMGQQSATSFYRAIKQAWLDAREGSLVELDATHLISRKLDG